MATDQAAHDLTPGTHLGRYEILSLIADGGMARVWAARLRGSRGFAKTVAIKTLLPGFSDDLRYESMFLDEAHLASRIRHPNVVGVSDLGEERGLLYLVMPYVDGEPLQTVYRSARKAGGVPTALALRILADTAQGLHAAHELCGPDGVPLHIVHRDVSPQNILVGYDGIVRVTDFGIARAVGRLSRTGEGTLKGKPAFMAPEQIHGDSAVDRRADVFALGIVAYQLLCDRHPFRGQTDLSTVSNIISERPISLPTVFNPGLDPDLEAIVVRALDRDPKRRYQTAEEFAIALDPHLRKGGMPRDGDLREFMDQVLGEQGRGRRKEFALAIAAADEAMLARTSAPPPSVQHRAAAGETPLSTPPSLRASHPPTGTELVSAASLRSPTAPPSRSAAVWLGIAGVLLGSAALGGGLLAFGIAARAQPLTVSERELTGRAAAPPLTVAAPIPSEDTVQSSAPLPAKATPPRRPELPVAAAPAASAPVPSTTAPSGEQSPAATGAAPRPKGLLPAMDPGF